MTSCVLSGYREFEDSLFFIVKLLVMSSGVISFSLSIQVPLQSLKWPSM